MKRLTHTFAAQAAAITLGLLTLPALAALPDPAAAARQVEYERLRGTALAVVATVGKIAPRYVDLRALDLDQVRAIIDQADQAAQRQEFDAAAAQARSAYELLRTSIASAVAQPAKP